MSVPFSNQALVAGDAMLARMRTLWPICRSITGPGVRETLAILQRELPALTIHEVPTGTRCFDWTVPDEWIIRDAYIADEAGRRVVDFAASNLHVVSYSEPIDRVMTLDELQPFLHSLPDQPDAIPYVTSYYQRSWGFCLTERARQAMAPGPYHVVIDSELRPGSLTYGEWILPGETTDEVFFSTYICHPSMANNELSGPCVTAELALWLCSAPRRFTYRVIFIPETIGALVYLSKHLADLQQRVKVGFVVNCVGDERAWSFMPSRHGHTLSDQVARHVLSHVAPTYQAYSFLQRGSDERQYCSPGVDLPVCSVMRSKYMTFPEYHTSLDNFDLVTATGLGQAFEAHRRIVEAMEAQCTPTATVIGEPKMSDRGLRPTTGKRGSAESSRSLMNLLAYADGHRSLLEIAEIIGEPAWELRRAVDLLASHGLIEVGV